MSCLSDESSEWVVNKDFGHGSLIGSGMKDVI